MQESPSERDKQAGGEAPSLAGAAAGDGWGEVALLPGLRQRATAIPEQFTPGEDFEAAEESPTPEPGRFRRAATGLVDRILDPAPGLLLGFLYTAIAVALTYQLLLHPIARVLSGNPYDQFYFEWQLTWVEHALLHFQNPFFSHAMNAPAGLNVEANPQIIGPAAVLTPITYLFGSAVSFALLTTFNLAATACTWRWFLRRDVVKTETAAFVGGLFLGFSPSMMSHSLAHPNLAGQWLVPLILHRVLKLRERDKWLRNGLWLGALITAQVFVGEELLFLTALGLAFYFLAYVPLAWYRVKADAVTFLKGSGVAVLTAVVFLAYPLSFQFFGPMSFKGIPFDVAYYSADLKSYAVWPSQELWGDPDKLDPLLPGNTEQAAAVGWVLLLVVVLLAVWCIRSSAVGGLLFTTFVLLVMSVGPTPVFNHGALPSPFGPDGIWTHLGTWPLFSSALPIRDALAISWIIGIILALGVDKAMTHRLYWSRGLVLGATAVALIPLMPRFLDASDRQPIPDFFTTGAWQQCVSPGHDTIVGVPLSSGGDRTNETWSTAADDAFNIPQGPVMAPASKDDKSVRWGVENVLWTAQWLSYINNNGGGATPVVTDAIKDRVSKDLAIWKANCIVVKDDNPNLPALKVFLDGAIGAGIQTAGVVYWKEPAAS